MPGLKQTGRMRKAIMEQMSLIRTKRHGHWKLVPVPPHKNREVFYTDAMVKASTESGHSPETIALWEPVESLLHIAMLPGDLMTHLTVEVIKSWKHTLQLVWTPTLLPSCVGCEYSNFKCTQRPPDFHCRILSMSKQTSLRPNVYWKRLVNLG